MKSSLALTALTGASLLSLTTAHFILDYPPSRGFDEDKEPTAPCGSFDTISTVNVTKFPIGGNGGPISLTIGHPQSTIYYSFLYGSGNASLASFNGLTNDTVAAVQETGLGEFCLPNVKAPAAATEGQNAVLQVVFNGPDGTLYQCADIIFSASAPTTASICSNSSSAITASAISGTGTSTVSNSSSSTSSAPSGSSSSSSSSSSTSSSAATSLAIGSGAIIAGVCSLLASFL